MPTARAGVALANSSGSLYAIGGYDLVPQDVVERYDPSTNRWETRAPLPSPRWGATAAATADGRIYVFGGRDDTEGKALSEFATTFIYEPASNSWTEGPALPYKRSGATAATGVDGSIFVIGGSSSNDPDRITTAYAVLTARVDKLDPVSGTWTIGARMPTPRNWAASTLGLNGIYVIGGLGEDGRASGIVEIYDSASDSWSSAATASMPRFLHGAATDQQGRIYALGGQVFLGADWGTTNNVEVYDPRANEWTEGVPMPSARQDLRAATVSDGRILVVGGSNDTGFLFYDAIFAFSPSSGTWKSSD